MYVIIQTIKKCYKHRINLHKQPFNSVKKTNYQKKKKNTEKNYQIDKNANPKFDKTIINKKYKKNIKNKEISY